MNWEEIVKIRIWTPLCEVAQATEMVLPNVYRIGDHAYLLAQPYNRGLQKERPGAPFITMAVWAGSTPALVRCLNKDVTTNVPANIVKPPKTLLLGTQGTYGELVRCVPLADRTVSERAVYSSTGRFVHKMIQIDELCFCFLEQKIAVREEVYAIKIALR